MKFISSFLLEYIIYIHEEEHLPGLFFVPRSAFILYAVGKHETFDTDCVYQYKPELLDPFIVKSGIF